MKEHICVLLASVFLLTAACFLPPSEVEQCDAVVYPPATSHPPALHIEGQYFKDPLGRVVLLRGVNATGDAKVPPFMPLADSSLLDPLPAWGVNVIRLVLTWEAFEPQRCRYDENYLDYYERVVDAAAERDIYVIVDFHQDAYSRFSVHGCGEGFPAWAVSSAVPLATPNNSQACANWGIMMTLNLRHHTTWNHFHSDRELARTRFLDMLTAVADRMAPHPNVIGYDIINEPWGTNRELLSLYEKAAVVIRSRHPEAILFVSPHALVSDIAASNMSRPSFDNFAYAPHFYDSNIWLSNAWRGNDPGRRLNQHLNKAGEWDVPMLLGEFGGEPDTANIEGYIEAIYRWLDARFIGGTQWCYTPGWTEHAKDGWNGEDFSIVDNLGNIRANFMPRPYPQKTAGIPISFVRSEDGFTYLWENNPTLGETELFVPPDYMAGKVLTVQAPADGGGDCVQSAQIIRCQITENGEVSVVVGAP
ncbi:MAG: cellulase family glycosylhydrolase [Phycisphaerales bacterium]|nr:MAG: cellulase family glycosylhydrolase [Phycisphaerales bacterium]